MLAPPTDTFHLDVEAISGICGSISIACWVVVFSPQIIQNFQGGSADALSIQFVIAWLLGDVFNIIGALLQGVLPTMTILAFYYAIADVVLLLQLFYYRGFTWRDEPPAPKPKKTSAAAAAAANTSSNASTTANIKNGRHADERTALLAAHAEHHHQHRHRRGSDWSGFSPAVPHMSEPHVPQSPPTTLQTILWNLLVIVMVCAAGAAGWFLGQSATGDNAPPSAGDGDGNGDALEFNTLGQVFGYLCAVLYIASRLPQLILNWRRKTTEGLSMLFFLFACLGNATYVLSIMAYEPRCDGGRPCQGGEAARLYGRYMLVNLSWLLGSAVTLLLDFGVFAQYFMYRTEEDDCALDEEEYQRDTAGGSESWARPLLEAGDSEHN
ncbi:putative vacuolar amino acid transporter [Escovopsis weberi]|uniref:Putative vacuolar amino acid transporter n=1 Tax=Escovopsis weberi TaxID=150374 RepID=A0A0M9VTN5_ESCWE|nr:putative vacuolar amino acid transporter [Escovopsis weberi]